MNVTASSSDRAANDSPLRIAVFGESIVSDWRNPAATTWRALLRALIAARNDAVFLEQRRNRAIVELLQARGAEPLRAFASRYPDLRYRTYDLPRGLERSVWIGRELATLDAVIVLDTAPPEIVEEIRAYRTPRLLRLWLRTGATTDPDVAADFDVALTSSPSHEPGAFTLGPSVEAPVAQLVTRRSGLLIVAYDNPIVANAAADTLAPRSPRLITAGALPAPWRFVPEVDLPDLYRGAEAAVVVSEDPSPLAAARFALPLGAGCPVVIASKRGMALPDGLSLPVATPVGLTTAIDSALTVHTSWAVPESIRADLIADGLIERIRRERAVRLGSRTAS